MNNQQNVIGIGLQEKRNDKSFQLYLSESSLHSGRLCFSAWRTAYYGCFDGGGADIGGSLLGRKDNEIGFH